MTLECLTPPSPHIESYKRFYNGLNEEIRKWLVETLKTFKEEGIISFDPEVKSKKTEIYDHPTPEEEYSCRVKEETLDETLSLSLCLAHGEGYWNWRLGQFPRITSRGSFIFNGKEKCLIAQCAESPGVFFTLEEKLDFRTFGPGDVRYVKVLYAIAELRPEYGKHLKFRVELEPEKNRPIKVVFPDNNNAPLLTLLDGLGFSPDEKEEIFENKQEYLEIAKNDFDKSKKQSINIITTHIGLKEQIERDKFRSTRSGDHGGQGEDESKKRLQKKFFSFFLGKLGRCQVNRRICRVKPEYNERSEYITKGDIAGILKAFIHFIDNDGAVPADDPWDLGNLRVKLVGDYLDAALKRWKNWMTNKIRKSINKKKEEDKHVQISPSDMEEILEAANKDTDNNTGSMTLFRRCVKAWVPDSSLSQNIWVDQGNLLEAVKLTRKITFNGTGGISIGHKREPRDLHWSHYGRLCPLDTPQSDDVGISLSITIGARINDLGILETACYKVLHEDGTIKINENDICWLSPWDEVEQRNNAAIAFPDQREALLKGNNVQAHRGDIRLYPDPVVAKDIGFIHASEDGMFSLAANLIPYRKHNDAVRGVMACGMIGQALPLVEGCAPKMKTGYESSIPKAYPFPYGGTTNDGEMSFGKEILVGYIPWKGWNFEDAFVISKTAAEKLTDVQKNTVSGIKLRRTLDGQGKSFGKRKNEFSEEVDLDRYDQQGIIKIRDEVSEGDQLVLEPGGSRSRGRKCKKLHKVPENKGGCITSRNIIAGDDGPAFLQFITTNYREAKVGDKLASRHGHKGVIGKIHEDHEMPYFLNESGERLANSCTCGETRAHRHLEMLINPLSVISRMNLGQLYETVDARSDEIKNLPEKVTCYDPAYDINDDKRTINNSILVGEQYIMKLNKNAVDQVHARSHIPKDYSAFVEQPLKGKRLNGGQRLGEMEVWALMAHNASNIMQEMLTLKSDNPKGRRDLFRFILQDIPINVSDARVPEALKTLVAFCYGLGISMTLLKEDGSEVELLAKQYSPEDIAKIRLSLLDSEQFKHSVSKGEIKTAEIGRKSVSKGESKALVIGSKKDFNYKYHPQGLESEQVFGPLRSYTCACKNHDRDVKAIGLNPPMECEKCGTPLLPSDQRRLRMGHIKLACPVPNPLYLTMAGEELRDVLGIDPMKCKLILGDEPNIKFEGKDAWKAASLFLNLALSSSKQFEKALENHIILKNVEKNMSPEVLKKVISERWKVDELGGHIGGILIENYISGIDLITGMLEEKEETRHLCLHYLPVISPVLRRPFKQEKVMYKTHDLTKLYQYVLNVNDELANTSSYRGSDDIDKKTEYMKCRKKLQLAVTRLFCNQELPKRYRMLDEGTVRRSLSSYIKGKEGLILGNLLGKRVDYSGRAVIVSDPELGLDECRIPFKLALKLFRPHLMAEMDVSTKKDKDLLFKRALAGDDQAVNILKPDLQAIISKHHILLNRQPTLHRLGLLGFKPMLSDDAVIAIPPIVTEGYNADFDGDQMTVYLPLTTEAKKEIREFFPSRHIWHPADGKYALSVAQDMTLGGYLDNGNTKDEIVKEFENCIQDYGFLEKIETFKKEAFERATQEGVSFSVGDFKEIADTCKTGDGKPAQVKETITNSSNVFKDIILSKARGDWETMVYLLGRVYDREGSNLTHGLTIGEQFDQAFGGRRNLVDTQLGTAEGGSLTKDLVTVAQHLWISEEDCGVNDGIPVSKEEEFWLLVDEMSGERIKEEVRSINGSEVTQLLWDEKGYMKSDDFYTNVANKSDLEQMCKEHPKRIPDRLVGVRIKRKIAEKDEDVKDLLYLRLYGRILAADFDDFKEGACLGKKTAEKIAEKIVKNGSTVFVRSPLSCKSEAGICRHCYGLPWNSGRCLDWGLAGLVSLDTRIGMIAAQAAGEPGTQMALRKKHSPGTTGQDDSNRSAEINDAKKCFQSNSPLLSEEAQVSDAQYRDTVDRFYRAKKVKLATIHFEVLLKGMSLRLKNKKDKTAGWVSSAAHPDRHLKHKGKVLEGDTIHVLAISAFHNREDSLDGLKERALVGGRLPSQKKEGAE
jgi:DNA-directed RNA polymerase beta subunit/DNA-directed RNA polymerase beta' subunit